MDTTPDIVPEEMPEPGTATDISQPEFEPVDLNEDGVVDSIFVQVNSAVSFIALDSDSNSSLDTAYIDLDGDGEVDVFVSESDGGYLIADATGANEAKWVSREELTDVAPELVAVLDAQLPATPNIEEDTDRPVNQEPGSNWSVQDGVLIGDPSGDAKFWFEQAENGFCLPASIAQIVSEYTGVVYENEMPFVDIANEIGAFAVGHDGVPGIPFEKGVEILNEAGVPAEYRFGDIDTLAAELDAGRSIILFIDSGEIWTGEASEDNAPDHAVVVTGIDTERGTVLLSDPGTPGGNLEEVPIELFLNSWADSQNAMIVCDEPPAEAAETAEGTAVPTAQREPLERAATSGLGVPSKEGAHPEPLEAVTSWAVQNPWILLPVVLLAKSLITR